MSELPTVKQLEFMVAVADTLNFRLAAESCFVTQPALSVQIQLLEEKLGVKLFERDRRRVLLTAAGESLVEQGRGVLADLRDMAEGAGRFSEPLTGTLRLGVIHTAAPYILPKALAEVRRRHPGLRVLIREGKTEDLVREVSEGSLDVVLLALEAELGDLERLSLFREPFVLAVPSGHGLSGRKRLREKDLRDEEMLLLDDGHCLRDQAMLVCERGGGSELGDFRASSLATLVQMVAGGVGVTLLPEMSVGVEGSYDGVELVGFGGNGPSRTIGLVWRKSSSRGDEFELLGEAIEQGCEDSL